MLSSNDAKYENNTYAVRRRTQSVPVWGCRRQQIIFLARTGVLAEWNRRADGGLRADTLRAVGFSSRQQKWERLTRGAKSSERARGRRFTFRLPRCLVELYNRTIAIRAGSTNKILRKNPMDPWHRSRRYLVRRLGYCFFPTAHASFHLHRRHT